MFQEHLESEERVDLETFTQKVWPNIKGLYQKSGEGGEEGKGEERPNDPQPPAIDVSIVLGIYSSVINPPLCYTRIIKSTRPLLHESQHY